MPQKGASGKQTDELLAVIHTCMGCSLNVAIEWWCIEVVHLYDPICKSGHISIM